MAIDNNGDRAVLAQLKAAGANLALPAHILFYLYFKSEEAANKAAALLKAQGYTEVNVHPAPLQSPLKRLMGGKRFSCIAETHTAPSEAFIFAATDYMNNLAKQLNGEYDGWEASVEN